VTNLEGVGKSSEGTLKGETFSIDLFFYDLRLHCNFVIELKTGKFKPEWAGKLNDFVDLPEVELDVSNRS